MTMNLKMEESFKSATFLLQHTGRQLPFERLVFIDPRVEDYQSLVAGVLPNTVVNILDVEQDGIQQISQALAFWREIKSIHIVSHGDPGRLYIGNSVLSDENLNRYAGQISGWANALSADAQILLYGCSVAQTEQGKGFVRRLGELTSAIVAASDNLTGSAALGGDWELEVMTGYATPTLAFAPSILEAYSAVLAGVTINPLGGVNVAEGGVTDTYQIVLNQQPTADVTIQINTGNQLTTDAINNTLTFTAANWNVAQTVTVTAVDDAIAEGTFQVQIAHTASGAAEYAGIVISNVGVNMTDNDSARINVNLVGSNASVIEGNTTAYSITLNSQPRADVTIQLNSGDQLTTDKTTLTFTAANWNVAQIVNVTAVDDAVAQGTRTVQLLGTATSTDSLYNNKPINTGVTIRDNDTAGITINDGGSLDVSEGGASDSYSIVLNSQPRADVTISINSGNQVTTDLTTLTFTAANWNVAQTVTATVVENAVAQGTRTVQILSTATSSDSQYNNVTKTTGVNITDNDTAGIIINDGGSLDVSEAGVTDSYSIVLNSQPTADVTISINSGNQVTTDLTTLTFTAANWNVAQTVTATAVDNAVAQGTRTVQILSTATSSDSLYNNVTKTTGVNIKDNDTAGIIINDGGSLDVSEGASDSYSIVLNSQPTADVTISINSGNQLTTDLTTLTFTAANWNVAQTVTATAVDDALAQGTRTVQILSTATSSDSQYNVTKSTDVNITDDDLPLARNGDNDVFTINGNSNKAQLQVALVGQNFNLVKELGVFTVDDAQGTIDGIAPGAAGYAEAAFNRSKVIFSAIADLPDGYNSNNITSLLELNTGDNLRFYLLKNSTSDDVRINKQYGDVLFSDSQNAKITDLGGNQFSLAWNDGSSNSTGQFQDLVVNFQSTTSSLVVGTKLQSSPQGEVIDLRSVTSQVTAQFVVNREADFNNFVGFYKVADENGGIDTNGDGQADIFAGQAGYTQAAVSGRVSGIDLTVSNQGTATYSGIFQPGAIYAPFLIANGSPDAILDGNSSDDPAVYFTYLGANTDGVDHVRLLGNNIFSFEDVAIGSDRDFNDTIVKVTFA
ncbi:hypothetical protein Cylst_1281 [Cylindrospermum stagnale PCC 7417]|uniref:DUF4347 domain-containing protein n=1 Tax=Cylindrospermum stagnale PCC 7417 TaxID=56107 RepID=K9WVR8_9NOST|nr:DUF4347 domain-containing protein [Cylindrospermum stagnale]AFZ23572.1 hypothetical protein Cylst_1281 [Cylindrospermum stagnale PCC 7417]